MDTFTGLRRSRHKDVIFERVIGDCATRFFRRFFSITLPLLRAYRAHLGQPLAVLHFDAHCDTWHDHFGEASGHGTWVYEAIEEGLVVKECFMQLGIRSAGERAAREYVRDQGGAIVIPDEVGHG